MRHLGIHSADSTDADALLSNHEGVHPVAHAPDIAAATVVALQQDLVNHNAAAETCAEGNADQILVATLAASLLQCLVDARQCSSQSLAVGKEVAVVVHIHGNLEDTLQVRAECYTSTEGREVGQVANHAALVVGRAREGETDGNRLCVELLLDGGKALHEGCQTALGVGCYGLKAHGFYNLFIVANGGENEVGAASIQRQHDFLVFSHSFKFFRYYVMSIFR